MTNEKPLLVSHFRVGDVLVRRKPVERYLVVGITQGNSLWGQETGLSVADRLVWLEGDSGWPLTCSYGGLDDLVWEWWATSWTRRQKFPEWVRRQLHEDYEFFGMPDDDEDDAYAVERRRHLVPGEWLHYWVRRGQADYLCRHGDYDPGELLNQQVEREHRRKQGNGGSFPPLDPRIQERKLKQNRAVAS